MKVYPVYGTLYDLFFGDGWKDWTRVRVTKEQTSYFSGTLRNQDLLNDIGKLIQNNNGSLF